MQYAKARQSRSRYHEVIRYESLNNVEVVEKRLMMRTRRGRKILAGMQKNGWVVRDAIQGKWRVAETLYTFERPILSSEELKQRKWQA